MPLTRNRLSYLLKCDGDEQIKYNILISSFNEPNVNLHKPVNCTYEFIVNCRMPKILQMIYLKNDEKVLFKHVKYQIPEKIILKNKDNHMFQALAFDEYYQPFFNFSTLKLEWNLQNNAEVHLLDQK